MFTQEHHGLLAFEKSGKGHVSASDGQDLRIAARGEHGGAVAHHRHHQACDPEPKADPDRSGECSVDDRERAGAPPAGSARRAPDAPAPQTRADPPASDERPAAEAEEAQDEGRGSERHGQAEHDLDQLAEAPDVSPNARVRPVITMMITPITLATGPCTESTIDWSGVSQACQCRPPRPASL